MMDIGLMSVIGRQHLEYSRNLEGFHLSRLEQAAYALGLDGGTRRFHGRGGCFAQSFVEQGEHQGPRSQHALHFHQFVW